MKFKRYYFLILSLLLFPLHSFALDTHEALQFVKDFYQIYHFPSKNPLPYQTVFNKKKNVLAPELRKALEEDMQAQSKVSGEIVGLDFDPFLNGQDPAENYQAGQVKLKGRTFWVEMFEVRNGKKSSKPSFWVETEMQNGSWRISNFHYVTDIPENENLFSILEVLKKDRQKSKSK
ncbi:MAG: DUF3828 domain-containing protein [Deltaproteobacteria bacterium]|nr:DUF3828 domain-containing protein [Deltaproteobacteria bacterium]